LRTFLLRYGATNSFSATGDLVIRWHDVRHRHCRNHYHHHHHHQQPQQQTEMAEW